MPICPQGHDSPTDDYCDVCGWPIGAPAYRQPPAAPGAGGAPGGGGAPGAGGGAGGYGGPAAPPGYGTAAGTPGARCPICNTAQTDRYCEECGYDYELASPPGGRSFPQPPAGGTQPTQQPPQPQPPHSAQPPVGDPRFEPTFQPQYEPQYEPPHPGGPGAQPGGGQPGTQPGTQPGGGPSYGGSTSTGPSSYGYPPVPPPGPGPDRTEQPPSGPDQGAPGGGYGPGAPTGTDFFLQPPGGPTGPGGAGYPPNPAGTTGRSGPTGAPGTGAGSPDPYGGYPQPPQPPAAAQWMAVVNADHEHFAATMARSGPEAQGLSFPPFSPERRVPLTGRGRLRIGRRSHHRGTIPEIDLSAPPEDPGASHDHAVLEEQPDGGWVVIDQESTNGTYLNGSADPITPHLPVPLKDGDRIHIGAWTTIAIHRA